MKSFLLLLIVLSMATSTLAQQKILQLTAAQAKELTENLKQVKEFQKLRFFVIQPKTNGKEVVTLSLVASESDLSLDGKLGSGKLSKDDDSESEDEHKSKTEDEPEPGLGSGKLPKGDKATGTQPKAKADAAPASATVSDTKEKDSDTVCKTSCVRDFVTRALSATGVADSHLSTPHNIVRERRQKTNQHGKINRYPTLASLQKGG